MTQIVRTLKQVGAAIRRRRRGLGLTQAELGSRAGLRQATISALENGETGTRLHTLTGVLAALDLELVIRARTRAAKGIEDVF